MGTGLETVINGNIETTLLQYQTLLDIEGIAILTVDVDGVITTISPSIVGITGHDPEALVGSLLLALVNEQYRDTLRQKHEDKLSVRADVPLIALDGATVWVRYRALPLEDGGFHALVQDITEQRQATTERKTETNRQSKILNALPDMLLIINADGVITEAYDNNDLDASDDGIFERSLDDTGLPSDVVHKIRKLVTESINKQDLTQISFTLNNSDYLLDYDVRIVPLNTQEGIVLVRDATAEVSQRRDLIAEIDDLNVIRQVNLELGDTLHLNTVIQLGLDATQRISGASAGFLSIVQPDGALVLGGFIGNYNRDVLEKILEKKGGFITQALQATEPHIILQPQKADNYVPLLDDTEEVMLIPLRSTERIVGMIQVESRRRNRFNKNRFDLIMSITGRVAAYLDNANLYQQTQDQLVELQNLYDAVRYLEQLKTDMIRIASHDLKNPLTGIVGYVDMLREYGDNLTDEQQEFVKEIRSAARQMTRITSSILSLERIEHMAQHQATDVFNLRDLVERTIAEHITYTGQKEQVLTYDLPKDAVPIVGDPFQLHEGLSNLISNAIKYTPTEGKIHIELKRDGCQALLQVKDTGYGIPESQHKRIFSPFFRAKSRETKKIEGTGLGLHLVKNIIKRHDGEMIFNSIYGEGSTFGFIVPIYGCE